MSFSASPQIISDEKVGIVNYLWDEAQYFVPAGPGIETTQRELFPYQERAQQSFCLIHSLTNIWLNPQSICNYPWPSAYNSPKLHRIESDSDSLFMWAMQYLYPDKGK